jgi:hypothetical protein
VLPVQYIKSNKSNMLGAGRQGPAIRMLGAGKLGVLPVEYYEQEGIVCCSRMFCRDLRVGRQ